MADAISHLGEIGSLLDPTADDLAVLDAAVATVGSTDLLGATLRGQLLKARGQLEALARRFDVVVANPPYMGSSSFNPFVAKWIKKHYPDSCRDLFSAFIERISRFSDKHGEVGIMCPFVWMFIGSYEKLRNFIIDEKTLTSLIQLEYSGFAGATVPICTFTFHNSHIAGYKGSYVRLSDFVGAANQAPKTLEAIQNPDCGWFYRADASTFHDIPGSPIAYWASEAMHEAFKNGASMRSEFDAVVKGTFTGDNNRFLRLWHEVGLGSFNRKWMPYAKGGAFRRWTGNLEYVINWGDDARELKSFPGSGLSPSKYFDRRLFCWSKISSSIASFRFYDAGTFFDDASPAFVVGKNDELRLSRLAFLNSTCAQAMLTLIAPTLNYQAGDMALLPYITPSPSITEHIDSLADCNIDFSKADWDSQETSWDFKRNPLV